MNKFRNLPAATLSAACLLLPSCAHTHQSRVADVATQVSDPSFVGRWKSVNGRVAEVKASKKTGYTVTMTDDSGSKTYDVDLLDIDGKTIAEIAVHEPQGKGQVPVYLYGRIDIKGDDITYRRLRNEWLEKTAKQMQGVVYKSTSDVEPNTGGVVVRDAQQMDELLEKAARDPAAFGAPERGRRMK